MTSYLNCLPLIGSCTKCYNAGSPKIKAASTNSCKKNAGLKQEFRNLTNKKTLVLTCKDNASIKLFYCLVNKWLSTFLQFTLFMLKVFISFKSWLHKTNYFRRSYIILKYYIFFPFCLLQPVCWTDLNSFLERSKHRPHCCSFTFFSINKLLAVWVYELQCPGY